MPVYGLALDGRDKIARDGKTSGPYLWISGGYEGLNLGHIDTSRCVDNASCTAEPVCEVDCSTTSCPSTCDDAIQAHYLLDPPNAYGITVDCDQRIWLGGISDSHGAGTVKRYDPFAASDERLAEAPGTEWTHGIAADAEGFIWAAGQDFGTESIWKIDAETLESVKLACPSKGVAIDGRGVVWSVPTNETDQVHTIEPTDDLSGNDVVNLGVVTVTGNPYMYSDFTGQQLRLASNEPGYYRQVFGPCEELDLPTFWMSFEWEAEVPQGTHVIISFRVSDTLEGLETASWIVTSVSNANAVGSKDVEALLGDLTPAYFEIEAKLFMDPEKPTGTGCYSDTEASPKVKKLSVTKECPLPIPIV